MVTVKGLNGKLVFIFGDGSFNDYLSTLEQKVSANKQLFTGSRVIFQGRGLARLNQEELALLQRFCLDNGMVLANSPNASEKPLRATTGDDNKNIFIRRNLRSGQKLYAEGSVLIWGDVHESAEIIAGGDIVVLGRLRGICHAGCYGDESRVVFALSLTPGQIRIGGNISRAAENEGKRPYPEVAFLEDGKICVREYHPRDRLPR